MLRGYDRLAAEDLFNKTRKIAVNNNWQFGGPYNPVDDFIDLLKQYGFERKH